MKYVFLMLSLFYTACLIGLATSPSIDWLTKSTLCASFGIAAWVSGSTYHRFKEVFK